MSQPLHLPTAEAALVLFDPLDKKREEADGGKHACRAAEHRGDAACRQILFDRCRNSAIADADQQEYHDPGQQQVYT